MSVATLVVLAGLPVSCLKNFADPGERCGNGRIEAEEQCDDGNTDAGDGCSDSCLVESGWLCEGEPSVCSADCGNGVLDPGEDCDDSNHSGADGCDPLCMLETGWDCTGEPSRCTPVCGDNLLVGGENCDGANLPITQCAALNLGDGTTSCTALCTFDVTGCSLQAECGNGGSGGDGRGYNQSDSGGLPGGTGAHSRCGNGGTGGAGGTWGQDGAGGSSGNNGLSHTAYNLSQSNGGTPGTTGGTTGNAIHIAPNTGGTYTLNDFGGIVQGVTD